MTHSSIAVALGVLAVAGVGGCTDPEVAAPAGRSPTVPKAAAPAPPAPPAPPARTVPESPTFAEHVAPLVYEHCAPCHREEGSAPFSF
ncbi:MAG: hypothetical protein AB1Z98_29545, partial [Nannocystaceae bacterium]